MTALASRSLARDTKGVTLIELVVALAITGVAVASGYGALSTLVDGHERSIERSDALLAAATARAALEEWLSGARVLSGSVEPAFRGLDGRRGDADDDEIVFVTAAETPLGTATARVRLAIDRESGSDERGLAAEFSDLWGEEWTRVLLVPEASELEVRYLSSLPGRRGWLPSWISSSLLPSAIELRIGSSADSLPALLQPPVFVVLRNALAM